LLSLAAGIMLTASFFSLMLPGVEFAEIQYSGKVIAVVVVMIGLFLGAITLYFIHRYLPHEHFFTGREGPDTTRLKRIWLFVIAITLHNFPEGMAVGVGFAGGDLENGTSLATAIFIQNIPEGLVVAISLIAINYKKTTAFLVAFLTGMVEPVGGLLGSTLLWLAEPMMPWVLGYAAGAMLFIISDEIIPETHRGSYANLATFSLLGGVALMMILNAALA